jgi:hypothetical protein
MKAIGLSCLVALAVIATVALVPASSWVFKNQADLFLRLSPAHPGPIQDMPTAFMPTWLTKPDTYAGSDPSQQLAHALFLPDYEANDALERYTEAHPNDPLGYALLVRRTCLMGFKVPDSTKKQDANMARRDAENLNRGLAASLKGEILEPNNAYFPFMRAVFDVELNRVDDLSSALGAAAAKHTYDSHVRDESITLEKALEAVKGYRGELIRIGMEATVLLPDMAHMKSLARYLNRHGTLAQKRDLIQTDYTIAQGEVTLVGLAVASSELKIVLREPIQVDAPAGTKLTDSEWQNLAAGFDAKLKASHIAPPTRGTLETYNSLARLTVASQKYIYNLSPHLYPEAVTNDTNEVGPDNSWALRVFFQSATPYAALASIVLSALFGLASCVIGGFPSETFRRMAPHLACLPAWLISIWIVSPWQCSYCDGCDGLAIAGLLFAMVQMCLAFTYLPRRPAWILIIVTSVIGITAVGFLSQALVNVPLAAGIFCVGLATIPWWSQPEKRPKFTTGLGLLYAIGSIVMFRTDSSGVLGGIAFLGLSALLWKRNTGDSPKTLSILAVLLFVLITGIAGAAITWKVLYGYPLSGYGMACPFGVIVALMFAGRPSCYPRIATCVGVLLFSAIYVGTAGWEVRGNREMSASMPNFLTEGDTVRALARFK